MIDALRLGLKGVARRPGLAVAIVVPLALATAVSAALFSIADGLFLRPLPLKNADRTVVVSIPPAGPRLSELVNTFVTPSKSLDFVESFHRSPLFSATINSAPGGNFNLGVVRELGLQVAAVDVRFFEHFGLSPAHGRLFTDDDQDLVTAMPGGISGVLPVILSDGYWRREFGGDVSAVGRQMTMAGRQVMIVGVMRPGVKFPGRTDVWTPRGRGTANQIRGFAQLAPDTTIEHVRAAFPLLDFRPLRDSLLPTDAGAVLFIFGTALSLLLLAWVQIGGLVLTNAADRLREVAVRLSLGASHRRIVAHFAAESFWLAAAALLLAWAAVQPLTHAVIALLPQDLTGAQYLEPGGRTFVFCGVTTALGFVLLTLTPLGVVRRVAAVTPVALMRGALTDSLSTLRVRRGLLVAQVAFTSLLLYVASLSAYSYLNVLRYDYGFDAQNAVIIDPPLSLAGMTGHESSAAWIAHTGRVRRVAERLARLPGVQVATPIADSPIPTWREDYRDPVQRFDGRAVEGVHARILAAGPDVIQALGATLVAGADFSHPDYRGRDNVVVVNETMARQLSPIVTVLGKRLVVSSVDATVIGVIRDLVDASPAVPPAPLVIQTGTRPSVNAQQILVRTTDGALPAMAALRAVVEEEFGPIRSTQMRLLVDDVEKTVVPWQGRASVLALVAAVGLPLAVLGLSSGLFFLVRTRTRELGIRLALGAVPQQARAFVLAYAGRIVMTGSAIGVVCGAVAGRAMQGQLFGVGAVSPVTTVTVAALVGGLAWCAAYVPARRASQVDPATVLRAE
jgi:putative ABC transport system permease protein